MWDRQHIHRLLERVADGRQTAADAAEALCAMPYEDVGCAKLDHHRSLRNGFPEVILCQPKTPEQVAEIADALARSHARLLGTRATPQHFEAARQRVADLQYHEAARAIWLDREPSRQRRGGVTILTAGTGDLGVAEEAALTLELAGHAPQRIGDVGVAGLHRLLAHLPELRRANVLVVAAGMDGALPGVVAGLVSVPVVAIPTSVGYGASFGGIAPLLTMLNACAAGVLVVNIDNGYGAGRAAGLINDLAYGGAPSARHAGREA